MGLGCRSNIRKRKFITASHLQNSVDLWKSDVFKVFFPFGMSKWPLLPHVSIGVRRRFASGSHYFLFFLVLVFLPVVFP